MVKHQARRDLDLVATIGAFIKNEALKIKVDEDLWPTVAGKLQEPGVDIDKPWLLMHVGVSEAKRKYPLEQWADAGKQLIENGYQLILTGSTAEQQLTDELAIQIGAGSFSAGGMFTLAEFICLVKHTPILLSVNTGTIHIAAAVGTPVVVLYAQTNPQHTPWGVLHKVLEFAVPEHLHSKNEVIAYVNKTRYNRTAPMPTAEDIVNAVNELLNSLSSPVQPFPEIPNENRVIEAS